MTEREKQTRQREHPRDRAPQAKPSTRIVLLRPAWLLLCAPLLACQAQRPATQPGSQQTGGIRPGGVGMFQGLRNVRVPQVSLDRQFYVAEQFCDAYGPAVRLANNKVYRLEKRTNSCSGNQITPPATHPGAQPGIKTPTQRSGLTKWFGRVSVFIGSPLYADTLPAAVSLAAQQTSIKTQVRNTCTYYATIAALEAAYKGRYGLDLDLSERHLNARLKMSLWQSGKLLPLAEVISGAWDGGFVETNLRFMVDSAVGVPLESLHPEVPAGETFSFPDVGDDPDVEDSTLVDQRKMDDFNLGDALLSMKIPAPLNLIPLPTSALLQARYRPTSIAIATAAESSSLDWYRTQLAAKPRSGRPVQLLHGF